MITYLQSINPITEAKKVSKNTRRVFDTLISKPEFISQKIAIQSSFPELASFSAINHFGVNFLDLPILKNRQILTVFEHTQGCHLHMGEATSQIDQVLLFLFFNCCLNTKITKVEDIALFTFASGKQEIISTLNSFPSEHISAILIPLQTSRKKLITWILNNWPSIKEGNDSLPKFSLDYLPKNILIGKEIADLKDAGHTFAEITDMLSDKYPDDDQLKEEARINVIYNRYKRYLINGTLSLFSLSSLKRNTKS